MVSVDITLEVQSKQGKKKKTPSSDQAGKLDVVQKCASEMGFYMYKLHNSAITKQKLIYHQRKNIFSIVEL